MVGAAGGRAAGRRNINPVPGRGLPGCFVPGCRHPDPQGALVAGAHVGLVARGQPGVVAPFPHLAHRTGQADSPHPALGQGNVHLEVHTFAHGALRLSPLESAQAQLLVQVFVRVAQLTRARYLGLRAQSLAHPITDVAVDAAVGAAESSPLPIERPPCSTDLDLGCSPTTPPGPGTLQRMRIS